MKLRIAQSIIIAAGVLLQPVRAQSEVSFEKELFINDSVIMNSKEARPTGAWHIRSALGRIAGSGVDVESYADAWFATWAANETLAGVNDSFAKRSWVTDELRAAWADNRIQLIAIVNRVDLARFPNGETSKPPLTLGEGRFIYEIRSITGERLPFTVIFEYGVPFDGDGDTGTALKNWAKRWRALGREGLGFESEDYQRELAALVGEFSAHGTLSQIRTNDFLPAPNGQKQLWELREFHHRERPAALEQAPVALTPAFAFSLPANGGTQRLRNFLSGEIGDLASGKLDSLPREILGATSPVPRPDFRWSIDAGADPSLERARFIFSFNTCSGCHAGDTGTRFQHIGVNTGPGLSPFLTGGIPVEHPLPPASNVSGQHNERAERMRLLEGFASDSVAADVREDLTGLIKARVNRVH